MSTAHSRVSSVGTMAPPAVRTGSVSVNVPDPSSRHVSVSGASTARWSTNSAMPPSKRKDSRTGCSPRRSSMSMLSPGTRKAVWRARPRSSSVRKDAPRVKICRSAQ